VRRVGKYELKRKPTPLLGSRAASNAADVADEQSLAWQADSARVTVPG
jgi:hypothetical protein